MFRKVIALSALMSALPSIAAPALAQAQTQTPGPNSAASQNVLMRYREDPALLSKLRTLKKPTAKAKVKQAPDLAGIPKYTGRFVFVHGMRADFGKGNSSYNCQYECGEKPAAVAEWYKKALEGNGWTVTANEKSPTSLTAKKDNLWVSLHAHPWPGTPSVTKLTILYDVSPKSVAPPHTAATGASQ